MALYFLYSYHGVGIPDCIHSAEMAVQTLLEYLSTFSVLDAAKAGAVSSLPRSNCVKDYIA